MKKEKKQSKIMIFILSHRKLATVLCIVMYILFTYLLCRFTPIKDNEKIFSLDRIGLSAEISSFLFIVISSIIAVWQYYISCRNEHYKNEAERIQKSIDLIEYYKDNVLDKGKAIISIFGTAGISEILKRINSMQIKEFDNCELHQLLSKKDIDELKKIENDELFITAILIANETYNLNLPGISYYESNSSNNVKVKHQKVFNAFMGYYITQTLNNLEFFAMHFTHNLAEENVIYQSAHQTFIEIVELLYYHISSQNTNDSSQKYYTNLIRLYGTWKEKQTKQNKEMINTQRCFVEHGASASKIEI